MYFKNYLLQKFHFLFTHLENFYWILISIAGCLKKHIFKMCYCSFAFVCLSNAHFIHTFYEKEDYV